MKLSRARSIRTKLNAILAVTTLSALVVAALALLAVDLRQQLSETEQDIVTQADVVALASVPALAFNDPQVAAENLSILRARPAVVAAALYDGDGKLFASFRREGEQAADFPPAAALPGVQVDGQWATAWRPVISDRDPIGTLYLQVRHDRLRQALEYLGVLVLIMAGSLGVALLLSNRLQRSLTGPILDVSAAAKQILRGDTGVRARKTTDDEVGALVDAFNAMLDELGRRAGTLESANAALRDSEARYQLAVRGSSAGLWDWNLRDGTMFYSPRFKSLLGYTDDEFPDVPGAIDRLVHPDDREAVRQALNAHLEQRLPYQVECRLQDRAGAWRWFFVAGAALWDETGQPYRMAGSVVEVTERKQAEQVLQEANRAKDEFIATLAHELRNPLAPIRTGLDILRRDKANGPASERARATMERQLAHMIRLIDDLLDISRITSGKIRLDVSRIHLRDVVDSALEISRPAIVAGGHALEVQLPTGDDIEVMGDPTRIAQALGNLLNNAAKYTPAGGRVRLRMRREADDAVIEVQDNGEGIPEGMLETIFSLFTQVRGTLERSQGGLGIGLYLVRSLVALHGGSVLATSDGPGQGSTFVMRLPCLPAHHPREDAMPPQASDAGPRGLKVLLVDDNVDAAETLAMVLEMDGCRLRTVHDGVQVLPAALEFGPDAILLDIGLPGMSGYEVAAQLRREPRFARTLLIAVTGWGAEQDRQRARDAGFDHHLTKPIEVAELGPLLHGRGREEALDT